MIHYILQTVVFQLIFLALYEFLLKKETFFQWNRAYLIVTPLLSLLLPFIKIPAFQTIIPQGFIVSLPEVSIGATTVALENNLSTSISSFSTFEIILVSGMAVSAFLFIWKLYKIIQLKRKGKTTILGTSTLVHLPNSTDAFSFAGTIYLGENLSPNSKECILAHEQVHVRQKHYLDLLYFEVLRIVFWFNPMVYLYQKRIATLQEYIADAEVVSKSGKTSYYQNILSEVFQTQSISFVNTFFNHSLIKKRIVMLHKSKSKKAKKLKYVLLIPVMILMLTFNSYSQQEAQLIKTDSEQEKAIPTPPEPPEPPVAPIPVNVPEPPIKGFEKQEKQSVPFAQIDQAPIYPGCEKSTNNTDLKNCFVEKISQLVTENFNTSVAKKAGLTGRQRIAVQFKINTQGNVVDILSRTPNKLLEEEAKRVIGLIPQMQPGKQDGKAVSVMYSLPIVFEVSK